MDRRTFVKTGAWLAAAGCVPQRVMAALERPGALVIVDASLADGRALADAMAMRAMPVLDVGGDIGALWYMTLAPHLARADAPLIGVVRASDFFVLKELAAAAGCRPLQVAVARAARTAAAVRFVIGGRPLAAQNR